MDDQVDRLRVPEISKVKAAAETADGGLLQTVWGRVWGKPAEVARRSEGGQAAAQVGKAVVSA